MPPIVSCSVQIVATLPNGRLNRRLAKIQVIQSSTAVDRLTAQTYSLQVASHAAKAQMEVYQR